ncbi:Uncharacterised protein [Vibrio cholerae]|nr:Uncharacterised protein [Vibrio cholerae]CSD12082.1 Uncharacterised protein [Vibrio cholerae]CSI56530.1 Uncharacterised protein [Vibrio cholerae]
MVTLKHDHFPLLKTALLGYLSDNRFGYTLYIRIGFCIFTDWNFLFHLRERLRAKLTHVVVRKQ